MVNRKSIQQNETYLNDKLWRLLEHYVAGQLSSTLIGIMFLSISLGEYLSGKPGAFMTVPDGISNPVEMMPYFSSIFFKIGIAALLISLLIMLLIPLLKKWMQEVR